MQQKNFKRNLIAASVAMTLGVTGTAFAAGASDILSDEYSPSNNPSISNKATALYSVDGVEQPQVESNEVTVTINPVSRFSLIAPLGSEPNDAKNEGLAATPGKETTFKNILTNEGNGTDTYTLEVKNEDSSIVTAADEYDFTDISKLTVDIFKDGGTFVRQEVINNGETVKLEKDEYAEISYTAVTPKSTLGGKTATLTLTATSKEIAKIVGASGNGQSLVNENQTIVTLPVFSIIKTASKTNINLNEGNNTFEYTIEVTNDSRVSYTTKAVNALIQDTLPEGILLNGDSSAIRVNSDNSSTKEGQLLVTEKAGRQVVTLKNVDIAVDETITITIPVKVTDDEATRKKLAAAGRAVNNADIYDNYDDTPVDPENPDDADIHDSTDGGSPNTDDDSNNPKDPGGDGEPSVVDFSQRKLVIEGDSSEELPPTSAPSNPAEHEHLIVNKGNKDESGLKVEITDPEGDTVNVTNVKYDPTPDQPNNGDEVTLTKGQDGKYDIPGTIAKDGGKGKISYEVVTDGADPKDYPTKVTVIPAEVNNSRPTVTPKTDTTSVKELSVVKEHAIDENCDGTPEKAFTQNQLDGAKPGQCIVYKITAANEFTSKVLKNVKVTDAASQWNAGATYVENSVTVSSNGQITERPNNNTGNVKATFATIPAAQSGWLQFRVKINNEQ